MKSGRYKKKFYRDWVKAEDLRLTQISAKETELQILTNRKLDRHFIENRIHHYRMHIENYIERDRRFLLSPKPVEVMADAPDIIKEMSLQARKADTAPMTTVAGAVAEFLGKELLKSGYKDIVVENVGSIFLKSSKPRGIGIYAGRSKIWSKLRLKIKPKDTPLGISTFSATINEAVSFGCADSVVVLSKSVPLAEAVSSATANRINSKTDLQKALDFARSIKGVLGIIIILKNNLVSWGKVEFVK